MTNAQKRVDDKFCNCKNSKCMKLYCECFAARMPCGKSCRCIDCQNTSMRDNHAQRLFIDRRNNREEMTKMHRGCACRRSNCTKKYCECFQSGMVCKDTCKCVDWYFLYDHSQNNESLTNRKVVSQLRKINSQMCSSQNSINLYPLYISQNPQHLHSIISQSNPLGLEQDWLQQSARKLFKSARTGTQNQIYDSLIIILSKLEESIIEKSKQKYQEESEGRANEGNRGFQFGSGGSQYEGYDGRGQPSGEQQKEIQIKMEGNHQHYSKQRAGIFGTNNIKQVQEDFNPISSKKIGIKQQNIKMQDQNQIQKQYQNKNRQQKFDLIQIQPNLQPNPHKQKQQQTQKQKNQQKQKHHTKQMQSNDGLRGTIVRDAEVDKHEEAEDKEDRMRN